MKWIRRGLLVLASLPVVAIAVLLLLGQREGAGRAEAQVVIERPCAEAFEHVADPERLRRWTGLTELRPLSPPPMQKGSRFETVSVQRGQQSQALGEVKEFAPPVRIVFELHSADDAPTPFSQTAVYRFQEEDGRCRVGVGLESRFAWLLQMLEPLVTPAIRGELERLLRALKSQVESESSLVGARRPPDVVRQGP